MLRMPPSCPNALHPAPILVMTCSNVLARLRSPSLCRRLAFLCIETYGIGHLGCDGGEPASDSDILVTKMRSTHHPLPSTRHRPEEIRNSLEFGWNSAVTIQRIWDTGANRPQKICVPPNMSQEFTANSQNLKSKHPNRLSKRCSRRTLTKVHAPRCRQRKVHHPIPGFPRAGRCRCRHCHLNIANAQCRVQMMSTIRLIFYCRSLDD